jgi:hypothetical protein
VYERAYGGLASVRDCTQDALALERVSDTSSTVVARSTV